MKILKIGVDDAGRGPVIGPMIIAGCLIDLDTEKELEKLGVKDSKQLTQKRREFLEKIIKEKSISFAVRKIYPDDIEGFNVDGVKLNEVEGIHFAQIIDELNDKVSKIKTILDCPSISIEKWKDFMRSKINTLSNLDLCCEHKADQNHICVGAASILAKCEREREMGKLKEKYGNEIGSGYCSDPKTKIFLEKFAVKYQDHGIFRKTWITWQNAVGSKNQKTLF
jgi:ribonuclease HII